MSRCKCYFGRPAEGSLSNSLIQSFFRAKRERHFMIPTVPGTTKKPDGLLHRVNTFLDEHVLPYPVKFLTNRIIILATLALLIPLVFFTNYQAFVNALNSYLNVMSVVVGS